MIRRPPGSTRTDTLLPDPTRVRSKAWAARDRYAPGTRMKSWTFVILRNSYLTILRRSRFRGEVDEESMNRMLTAPARSEEHTSELQSLMRISYAVFCLKKKNK